MALFEALSDLVASAVLSAAPACDLIVPPDASRAPQPFIAWLKVRNQAGPVNDIIDALAREIWVGSETRSLPQQALELHATAAASLLASHPPHRAHLNQAIERARTGATGIVGTGEPMARRIAVDVFARARASGAVSGGVRDDVTLFLIDRVYAHLLDDPKVLYGLAPTISEYIAQTATSALAAKSTPQARAISALGLSASFAQQLEAAGGMAFLAELGTRYGVSEQALQRVMSAIDSQGLQADERLAKVEEIARWIGEARAQLQKPSNEEAEVRRLKARAAAALAEGNFEAAAEALRMVRRELREGRRRIEERLQDEVAGLRSQMLEEANAAARLAEVELASGNAVGAAELFADAALSLPSSDRASIWQYSLMRAEALLRHGTQTGEPAALNEALSAYGYSVRLAADGSNQRGLGLASLGLGNTLLQLGERESGTARLKDAAAAFRKAVQLLARDDEPRSWALAQLRLGRTLALVGERDKAITSLRDAAQAFREALQEIKPDRMPNDYAQAQMGLGGALLSIEEREGGIALMEEAADAYTGAISALARDEAPVDWAEANLNLGLALLGIGEQKGAMDILERAVGAFRSALEAYTRPAAPQKWALTQMNLGNALAAIGERAGEHAVPRLEDAVACYHQALEEFRRETEPLKWAITQMNLGTALIRLGEHGSKRRYWLAAAGALVPALEVFETQGADAYADVTRRSLKRFHEDWEALIAAPSETSEASRRRLPKAV